ncbi:SDR family oxidoreductase [Streptacidiphilus rugosus]|uniref:SDR family oxidoreductase n=1 Tax=Streptacidiphilus rugosus TaxID=405783 RepID=UPI000AA39EED|nr:SDR family oxidoreductase [Streptacidiphilus rugosus]
MTSDGVNGRVALVTGGSRGLGLLIARELLGRGCLTTLNDRAAARFNQRPPFPG